MQRRSFLKATLAVMVGANMVSAVPEPCQPESIWDLSGPNNIQDMRGRPITAEDIEAVTQEAKAQMGYKPHVYAFSPQMLASMGLA